MRRSLNRVQLVGAVGSARHLRYTAKSGTPVVSFAVAVERARRGPDGAPRLGADYFRIVAFGGLAATCARHLRPGAILYVEGQLVADAYRDKEGVERTSTEIIASVLFPLADREAADPEALADQVDSALPY